MTSGFITFYKRQLSSRERNKEIEKIEKYSQKNVRIVYNALCVCVGGLYLRITVCGHISDV